MWGSKPKASMGDRAVRRMENQRYQRQVTRQAQGRARAAQRDAEQKSRRGK